MDLSAGIGVALGFVLGIPAHQFVTHRVAIALGDHSSRLSRRAGLSLKAHADPIGTYIIPGVWVVAAMFAGLIAPPFGWGKRHSLNPRALRNRKRDMILIALSGPAATAVIAVAAGILANSAASAVVATMAIWIMFVNVTMTFFELLPIPGRDGGKILQQFLSPNAAMKMEEFEQYDVLFLIVLYLLLAPVANGIFAAGCRALTSFCRQAGI